jgi:hypothetical protein
MPLGGTPADPVHNEVSLAGLGPTWTMSAPGGFRCDELPLPVGQPRSERGVRATNSGEKGLSRLDGAYGYSFSHGGERSWEKL